MALTNLLVAAVTCGLVGGALAWAELHAWPGLALAVGLRVVCRLAAGGQDESI